MYMTAFLPGGKYNTFLNIFYACSPFYFDKLLKIRIKSFLGSYRLVLN